MNIELSIKNNKISPYYQIKTIFVGRGNVGKTTMIDVLDNNERVSSLGPTVCMRYVPINVTLYDYPLNEEDQLFMKQYNKRKNFEMYQIIQLNIWDCPGNMAYHSLLQNYTSNTNLVFLLFDMNDIHSWDEIPKWKEKIEEIENPDRIFVLVGTKSDLEHFVTLDDIDKLAKKWNCDYYIISSKDKKVVFSTVTEVLKKYHEKILRKETIPEDTRKTFYIERENKRFVKVEEETKEKKGFCCFQ